MIIVKKREVSTKDNYSVRDAKGEIGEDLVLKTLEHLGDEYFLLNDVNFYKTQIDHVLISVYGIYTIETKYYDGLIEGSEDDWEWTQSFREKKRRFENPIRQAKRHSIRLNKVLNEIGINIWVDSIVVFTRSDTNLSVKTEKVPVVTLEKLLPYLKSRETKPRLRSGDIFKIIDDIYPFYFWKKEANI